MLSVASKLRTSLRSIGSLCLIGSRPQARLAQITQAHLTSHFPATAAVDNFRAASVYPNPRKKGQGEFIKVETFVGTKGKGATFVASPSSSSSLPPPPLRVPRRFSSFFAVSAFRCAGNFCEGRASGPSPSAGKKDTLMRVRIGPGNVADCCQCATKADVNMAELFESFACFK